MPCPLAAASAAGAFWWSLDLLTSDPARARGAQKLAQDCMETANPQQRRGPGPHGAETHRPGTEDDRDAPDRKSGV